MSTITRRVAVLATSAAATALGVAGVVAPTPAQATPVVSSVASATSHAGWVATEIAPTSGRTALVELVSPAGKHIDALAVPKSEILTAVSGDGRRVLTAQGNGGVQTYRVHDVLTGRTTTFTGNYAGIRFTAPSGTALLGQPFNASGVGTAAVQRLDLSGHRQATYAGTVGQNFLPSLNGTYLVGTTKDSRLTVNANATGRLLRVLPKPKGFSWCQPVHNASASAVYATCGNDNSSQVFRYALSGGAPVSMTGALPVNGFGYVDYWTQPSGTWVHAGAGCGSGPLMKVVGRRVQSANLPVSGSLVGVAANHAYVENSECEDGPKVSAVDLSTRAVTTLFTSTPSRPVITWTLIDPTA